MTTDGTQVEVYVPLAEIEEARREAYSRGLSHGIFTVCAVIVILALLASG